MADVLDSPDSPDQIYTSRTEIGTPCTDEGYTYVEEAEKLRNISYERLDSEIRLKLGPMMEMLEPLADASIAAFRKLTIPRQDQIQLLDIFVSLALIPGLKGNDLRADWVLVQAWLCKRADVRIAGMQSWDEYYWEEDTVGPDVE